MNLCNLGYTVIESPSFKLYTRIMPLFQAGVEALERSMSDAGLEGSSLFD
jgi:hypothetical protein